jgi:hypothetical protein
MSSRSDIKGKHQERRSGPKILGARFRQTLGTVIKKLRRSIRRQVKRDLAVGREVDGTRSLPWIV